MKDVTLTVKYRCADTKSVETVEEAFLNWLQTYIELNPDVTVVKFGVNYLEEQE